MERFIADLVRKFETGKVNRRQVCETIAIAAAVYGAGARAANAASPTGFKMIGINHISYVCPDYRKARAFYTDVLGMADATVKDDGKRANLVFGPAQGKGGSFLIARNADDDRAPPKAVIDHICYTITNWNDDRVSTALKAHGLNPTGRAGSLNVYDPFDFSVQLASIAGENPFR